eukprot:4931370-Amphidinium_carterae.1
MDEAIKRLTVQQEELSAETTRCSRFPWHESRSDPQAQTLHCAQAQNTSRWTDARRMMIERQHLDPRLNMQM